MKKILILAPLFLITLGSCRKDRSCTCSDSSGELGTAIYTASTRSEAKNACQGLQAQYSLSYPGTTCTLK